MAAFLTDTFTDTDGDELSLAHTGEVGATWTKQSGGGGNHLIISSNRACRNNAAASVWVRYTASGTPPTADYYAEAVVRPLTVAQYAALAVRCNGTYTDAYEVWFTNTGILIVRLNASTPTTLTTQAFTWTAATDYLVRLEVSGTGATVSLTVKIDGATIATASDTSGSRITSTGTVGIAGFDGSTTTGFVFASITGDSAATDTITINAPTARRGYSRSGTTGNITGISVTHSGATDDIEASFNGGAYVTIASAMAAGTATGLSLNGQTNGQGTLTIRKKSNTAVSATVADITISDVFVLMGDSIAEGRATNVQNYSHATLKPVVFREDDAWALAGDPVDTGTSAGSHWPLLATQFMASTGLPPIFISVGKGSTDVAGSANTWAKPGAEYTQMTTQVTQSGVASVKAVLAHLGPNAVVNASLLSQATYNAAIDTLAANIAADIAGAPKLFVSVCGEVGTGAPPDRRSALNNIRAAVLEAASDNANVKLGPVLIDQNYTDNVHPQTDAEVLLVAKRWWTQIGDFYYGASNGRGPRLSSASWNAGRNQLTIVFDRPLKTGLSFSSAAWIVLDNVTTMTISSIAYHGSNPNALIITTSAAAVGAAGSSRVTFASGDDAIGLVLPQSVDITPPTGTAFTLPAEPFYSAVVTEASTKSISITLTTDGTTPAAGLTNLKWAWFDQITPDLMAAPTDKGALASTDGAGLLTITLPNTTKTSGQIGWLVVTNSDGTTTQSPAHKAFSGPVAVS